MTTELTVKADVQKEMREFDTIGMKLYEVSDEYMAGGKRDTVKEMQIAKLRAAMRPFMGEAIISLLRDYENDDLGFLTDKPTGYDDDTLLKLYLRARQLGLSPFNNEFNIIKGKLYTTKNGWARKCYEKAGLEDIRLEPGDIEIIRKKGEDDIAKCEMLATWKYRRKQYDQMCVKKETHDARIIVTLQKGMGIDGARGKAMARIYRMIWEQVMGVKNNQWIEDQVPTDEVQVEVIDTGTAPPVERSPANMEEPPEGQLFSTVAEVPE